jgi:hypothetical protein
MKVGDLVKEKNGPGIAIVIAITEAEHVNDNTTFVKVVYLDGEPFKHSSSAYRVINESR